MYYFLILIRFFYRLIPKRIRITLAEVRALGRLRKSVYNNLRIYSSSKTAEHQPDCLKTHMSIQAQVLAEFSNDCSMESGILILVTDFNQDLLSQSLRSIERLGGDAYSVKLWIAKEDKSRIEAFLDYERYKTLCIDVVTNITELDGADRSWLIIRQGDEVWQQAESVLAKVERSRASIGYFDYKYYNSNEQDFSPALLPDWDPDLQLSTAYINTALWLRELDIFKDVSLTNYSIAEFLVRLYFQKKGKCDVCHFSVILVSAPGKLSCEKSYSDVISSLGKGEVNCKFDKKYNVNRLKWSFPDDVKVSVIIPTYNARDLVKTCIDSIKEKTSYNNYEIILVDNNSDDLDSLEYFESLSLNKVVKLIRYPHPFNYSAINNYAVNFAEGEVIAFLNNDVEVIEPDWMTFMVAHAMREEVGCVGAKLLYPNGLIQHAGVVLGYGGGAGHAHKCFRADDKGYLNRLQATNSYSAVTAACLFIRKKLFLGVNGFDEQYFKVAFNDVDLNLKIVKQGYRNVYCAESVLYHHESISRGEDDTPEKSQRFSGEVSTLKSRWGEFIYSDPCYHPALTLSRENFTYSKQDFTHRLQTVLKNQMNDRLC